MKLLIAIVLTLGWQVAPVQPSSVEKWDRDPTALITHFDNMYQPCVVKVGGKWAYRMWFFGWATDPSLSTAPTKDAVFTARSKDLKHWEVYSFDGSWDSTENPKLWKPVISAGSRWYDTWHNGDPSVVFKDGKYLMAYSSCSRPFGNPIAGYPNGMVLDVMGAESDDGIHWTKTDQPLLIRVGDSESPNAEPDRIGDFNRPSLMWDKDRYKLWFDYWIPGKGCCLGCAENRGEFSKPGGFHMTHALAKPQLENWVNPDVIKVDGKYLLFGDPPGYPVKSPSTPASYAWMSRAICEASSSDGVHWTRLGYIPPDSDVDACHVPQAFVTEIGGKKWLYLFYATQVGFRRGDGQYHFEYDKLRAMRRRVH